MKKILSSWVFVLCTAIFLLVLGFVIAQYNIERTSPSKGWSRAIRIADISSSETRNFDKVSITTLPIVKENSFVTLWEVSNVLNYQITSSTGNIMDKGTFNYKFPEFYDTNSTLHNGSVEYYGLSEKGLYKYVLDIKKHRVSYKGTIDKNVKNFIIKNDMIIYSTDNSIKLIDNNRGLHVIDKVASPCLDASEDKGTLYIGYAVENPQVDVKFHYVAYDSKSNSFTTYKSVNLMIMHSSSFVNSVISVSNNYVTNLAVFRDWDSGNTWTENINFDLGKSSKPAIDDLDLQGSNPDPRLIKTKKGNIEFIAQAYNQITYKTAYPCLAIFTAENSHITNVKFLTKTQGIAKEPKIFTLGKDTYLQWEDVSANSKTINFASTNLSVIQKARHLRWDEIKGILINTLFGIGYGIAFLLLFVVVIVFPPMLIIVMISMFALNWLEANTKKVLNICIALQFAAKVLVVNVFNSVLKTVKPSLPVFLQSAPGLYTVIVLTTLVAVYCVKKRYYKEESDAGIIEQYAFFAVIDLFLFSLIYYPYYQL